MTYAKFQGHRFIRSGEEDFFKDFNIFDTYLMKIPSVVIEILSISYFALF